MITQEYLKSILNYYPEIGISEWKESRGRVKTGDAAGTENDQGYIIIRIDGQRYREHVLAWFYMTGEWPENEIDHIDGNSSNNKWKNLRTATHAQNQKNRKSAQINSKSGVKGVHWREDIKKYCAKITVDGEIIQLGFYYDLLEAEEVRKEAEIKYFKEFSIYSC